jgi:hypothetical protein
MLFYRCAGHVELGGDLSDGHVLLTEMKQDFPSRRIGERAESTLHDLWWWRGRSQGGGLDHGPAFRNTNRYH